MKKFLVIVAIATLALTGCGNNRSAKKIQEEARQAHLNYELAQIRNLYEWAVKVEEKVQAYNATSPEYEVPSVLPLVDTSFLQIYHDEKLDEMLKDAKQAIEQTEQTLATLMASDKVLGRK